MRGILERMERRVNPNHEHEAAEESIERAAAEDTDVLMLLETEDALNAIPDAELSRSEDDALEAVRPRGDAGSSE